MVKSLRNGSATPVGAVTTPSWDQVRTTNKYFRYSQNVPEGFAMMQHWIREQVVGCFHMSLKQIRSWCMVSCGSFWTAVSEVVVELLVGLVCTARLDLFLVQLPSTPANVPVVSSCWFWCCPPSSSSPSSCSAFAGSRHFGLSWPFHGSGLGSLRELVLVMIVHDHSWLSVLPLLVSLCGMPVLASSTTRKIQPKDSRHSRHSRHGLSS